MAGLGDLTLTFQTVGEAAAAGGAERLASSVGNIRKAWSDSLDKLGKAQARLSLLSSVISTIGVDMAEIGKENQKASNSNRNALGTGISTTVTTGLQIGGSLAGALAGTKLGAALGSFAPGIGNIVGGIIGAAAGAVLGDTLEPAFQQATVSWEQLYKNQLTAGAQNVESLDKLRKKLRGEISGFFLVIPGIYNGIEKRFNAIERTASERYNEIYAAIKPQIVAMDRSMELQNKISEAVERNLILNPNIQIGDTTPVPLVPGNPFQESPNDRMPASVEDIIRNVNGQNIKYNRKIVELQTRWWNRATRR